MNSKTTKRFREPFADLPSDIQRRARKAYKLFIQDPNHPSLRFKKIHASDSIYSARINVDYRAVGIMEGEEIIWFWIGSHADYDKLLKQL